MFALFALLPFVANTACKFNSTIPCFRNAALLLHTPHTVRFSSVMFLSGACAWATPSTLATPSLGDAFSCRRLLLATPSLGDAFYWRRLLLATPSFLPTPIAASNGEKIKTKNQGKVFLKLVFSFIWVTSLKNPGKGKRASPLTRPLHRCLHKSTKIKLQVGCTPTARDGTPLQGL